MQDYRCLHCSGVTNGERPINCTRYVSIMCVGPKQTELDEAKKRIAELDLKLREKESQYVVVFRCQSCGQRVINHKCGC